MTLSSFHSLERKDSTKSMPSDLFSFFLYNDIGQISVGGEEGKTWEGGDEMPEPMELYPKIINVRLF